MNTKIKLYLVLLACLLLTTMTSDYTYSAHAQTDGSDNTPLSAAWNYSGDKVAIGYRDGFIRIWATTTSQLLLAIQAHSGAVSDLDWNPDGSRLISGGGDHKVKIWDTQTGQNVTTFTDHEALILAVAFSTDGSKVASTDIDGKPGLILREIATGQILYSGKENGTMTDIRWSPDGSKIGLALFIGAIDVRDASTLKPVWYVGNSLLEFAAGDQTFHFNWSPDSSLLVFGTNDGQVRVWNAQTGQLVWNMQVREYTGDDWARISIHGVAFSPDGQCFQSISGDGTLRVWDTSTGQILSTTNIGEDTHAAAFNIDGSKFISAGAATTPPIIEHVSSHDYPFFEDFESGTAGRWTLTDRWAANSSQFHSPTWSVRNLRGTDYTAFTDMLTLNDPLNLSEATAPYLTYWSRYKLSTNERVQVQVSTDDGVSWTTVETYFDLIDLTWHTRRINLSAYAGQTIRLRFVFVATACTSDCMANTAWWIDDVKVDEFPDDALNEGFETGTGCGP